MEIKANQTAKKGGILRKLSSGIGFGLGLLTGGRTPAEDQEEGWAMSAETKVPSGPSSGVMEVLPEEELQHQAEIDVEAKKILLALSDGQARDGARSGEGKRKRKGKAKNPDDYPDKGEHGQINDDPQMTEEVALKMVTYDGAPLLNMLKAELSAALDSHGLSTEGLKQKLRVRLARKICEDILEGCTGGGELVNIEVPESTDEIGEVAPGLVEIDNASVNPAIKRKPGRPRKLPRSQISGFVMPRTEAGMVNTIREEPGKEPKLRTEDMAIEMDVEVEGKEDLEGKPEAAEAIREVKGRERGRVTARTRSKAQEETLPEETSGGAVPSEPLEPPTRLAEEGTVKAVWDDTYEGVPLSKMTVSILTRHVKALGLTPTGRKKADLLICLRNALSGGAAVAPGAAKGSGAWYDSDAGSVGFLGEGEDSDAGSVTGVYIQEPAAGAAPSVRSPSPRDVLYKGTPVPAMSRKEVQELLHYLELPSLHQTSAELRCALMAGLVQRQEEARSVTDKRWGGRRINIMRKAEVEDALEELGASTGGKYQAMRARLQREVTAWADNVTVRTVSRGDGGGRSGHNVGEDGAGKRVNVPEMI
ncbi:unnamed protein product, partial [Discosporangium mesarthrocarpum]